jgi:RNA polymerase sigma-70 factor (ECF subfamily)
MCRGNEDRAQDLAQDALVRAYEAYEHPTPFSPAQTRAWLLRILTNGFINEYRRRAKWEAGVDAAALAADGAAAPPALRADDSDTPGAALLTGTLDEPLERALAALPEAMRLCVLLVDVEGLDYAEAAQALSVPVGTVRSRLSRARLRLQTTLRDYALDRRLVP